MADVGRRGYCPRMATRRRRLVWKYEFTDDDGTEIGPLWIDTFGDDGLKPVSTEDLGWTTREQAQTIAERRGCQFVADTGEDG